MSGTEDYESLVRYGHETCQELENMDVNGLVIEGIHHDMKVLSSGDWKAASCIEGIDSSQNF